jgi:hypothetical protein
MSQAKELCKDKFYTLLMNSRDHEQSELLLSKCSMTHIRQQTACFELSNKSCNWISCTIVHKGSNRNMQHLCCKTERITPRLVFHDTHKILKQWNENKTFVNTMAIKNKSETILCPDQLFTCHDHSHDQWVRLGLTYSWWRGLGLSWLL